MITQKRRRNRFFWLSLTLLFLLSGGSLLYVSADEASSPLIINEFLTGNDTGPRDEDGDPSDWIEIYNRSDQPVNLSGWSLTDDRSRPLKWAFPDITLASHDYLVVFASGKNRKVTEAGAALHTNFKLSRTDQFLGLHNVLASRFMDEIPLDDFGYFRDVSYGRSGEAIGYFTQATPGDPNETPLIRPEEVPAVGTFTERVAGDADLTLSEEAVAAILQSSALRVSEIMYNPQGGSDYEFIELQNVGDTPLDLGGVYFDQGIEFSFHYGIPPLPPGGVVVLAGNAAAFTERYPDVEIGGGFDNNGVFDGNLSNRGERIVLKNLLGNVVALVEYDDENGWPLSPDGQGDSLVLVNPQGNPTAPHNWRASVNLYGSPGRAEPPSGTPASWRQPLRLLRSLHLGPAVLTSILNWPSY